MARKKKRKEPAPLKMIATPQPAEDRDDADYGYSEPQACWECGGRGWKITCIDDMCHGLDECIHGDGETTCDNCGGTGDEP